MATLTETAVATASGLTRAEVIEGVQTARALQQAAAVRELELALAWARLHPCSAGEPGAHWGDWTLYGEGLVALAGPGAPQIAEFAPSDLAAALGISLDSARRLLADVLELAYRLPRLWDLVRAGKVAPWRARAISTETHDLSREGALFADRLICAAPERIGLVEAARLVQEARLFYDPDRAAADESEALARRGVWVRHGRTPATSEVTMTLDTLDAELLDQTIARIAGDLRGLGDTDPLDARRATAVGILADPQHALDLMSGRPCAPTPGIRPTTEVHLHLTPDDLAPTSTASRTGVAVVEKLGAVTTGLLDAWLTRYAEVGASIRVRPVLDLGRGLTSRHAPDSVDAHDPPAWMRESVLLRHATCVFPGCRRDSRACDLDHITAYLPPSDGGPPGQTTPANLAPLCRTHHRVKTHGGWTYKRRDDDYHHWTSPTGHQYDVPPNPRRPLRS